MSENDTLAFLNSLGRFGWRLGLENISRLLSWLGNPERRLAAVHVAGTNGKGSTTAMLESIWRQAGYKTGLYTSPHLVDVTERIRVNGGPISSESLSRYIHSMRPSIEALQCTYFEALTAVAFQHFADQKVDLAFVEVGLGGRFDATNVLNPLLTIITNISLDHTDHLGQTTLAIAEEKAGIIKEAVPLLTGCDEDTVSALLQQRAVERKTSATRLDSVCSMQVDQLAETFTEVTLHFGEEKCEKLRIGLAGRHQVRNAALAAQATRMLIKQGFSASDRNIRDGLRNVRCRGRLEVLQSSPTVVADVAHNPAAISALMQALIEIFPKRRVILVIGVLRDKDYAEIASRVADSADYIFAVSPASERALGAEILTGEILRWTKHVVDAKTVMRGFEMARLRARAEDVICITGSHYVVGEFLNLFEKT